MDINFERDTNLRNQLLTFAVVTILILTGVYILYPDESSASNTPFKLYTNNKNAISGSYFIELDGGTTEQWQFSSATGFIPAILGENFIGGKKFQPLIFSTSPEVPRTISKYHDLKQTIHISELGNNANAVSVAIAQEYWASIRTIVIVDGYQNALLVTPLAVSLNLPIIIDGKGTNEFINDNNIKSAITMGKVQEHNDIGIEHLEDKYALWEMYLDVLNNNNEKCEYLVATNPYDIDFSNQELYIPGLSLASSILASGRNGLLIADDYTVDLSWIQQLGYGLDDAGSGERGNDEDTLTDDDEQELQLNINSVAVKLDQDISEAAEFLKAREHDPKYLALVGGPAALPMMYLKSPVWLESEQDEKGEEYIATEMYFGDLDIELDAEDDLDNNYDYTNDELYGQELAVGRIVGQELVDATALVSRSLGYRNYEYIDDGDEIISWQRRSLIITSLMTGDSDNLAARHQQEMFLENLMVAEKYDPNTIASTEGVSGLDVKSQMERVNGIIYDGHGYPDGWYHMWTTTGDEDADWDRIGAEDINELTLHAVPVFGACCLSSALDWPVVGGGGSNEKVMTPDNCISLAFIRAGAMCYIGATEESWGAFLGGLFDDNPDAYGYGAFDMPTMFWEELLNGYKIGPALNLAKDKFMDIIWTDQEGKPFARLCLLEMVLYGDPAADNEHPGIL